MKGEDLLVRDGDGWIEHGTNASADMLHQFLQLQEHLEKQAKEYQNYEQGRQQVIQSTKIIILLYSRITLDTTKSATVPARHQPT